MRLPANPEIGAEARVCIPLRARDVLLGFMFIVDAEETLGAAELAQAEDAANEAAQSSTANGACASSSGSVSAGWSRTCSATTLRTPRRLLGRWRTRGSSKPDAWRCWSSGRTRSRRAARSRSEPRSIACGGSSRRGAGSSCAGVTTVSSPSRSTTRPRRRRATSPRACSSLADEAVRAEAIDAVTRVGIGGAHPLAAARLSYRQARDAVAVAQRVARFGRVAAWDELGVYRTLVRFPDDLDDEALHPGLVAAPARRRPRAAGRDARGVPGPCR